jgi:hypothetical protein
MPQFLEGWFGHGDDDFPVWLATVRINVVLLLAVWAIVLGWHLAPSRLRETRKRLPDLFTVLALTAIAALLRFAVAAPNLFDHGGIAYSRLLLGYKGHFAAAQLFAPIYRLFGRTLDNAIRIDRVLGTLSIPIVYALARVLAPQKRLFAALAAGMLALHPLHILFSASDALSIVTVFLSSLSWLLVARGVQLGKRRAIAALCFLGGFLGLALLTQARYENVLLVIPVVIGLLLHRKQIDRPTLAAPLGAFAIFMTIYAVEMATSGLSYQNPVRLSVGARVALQDIFWNPFLAVPLLSLGAIIAAIRRRDALGIAGVAAIAIALSLAAFTTDTGHHAARVFSSWLPPILVGSGLGFAILWSELGRAGKMIAALALAYLAALPLLTRERLTTRYLEIEEHDRFAKLLRDLPGGTTTVIVPDDDQMNVRYHSTFETFTKYAMIRDGIGADRVALVGISDYLLRPEATDCRGGKCLFFAGLPCEKQEIFPFVPAQCTELLRAHRTSILDEKTVFSAPFVSCSIYVGSAANARCAPATHPWTFTTYRIED